MKQFIANPACSLLVYKHPATRRYPMIASLVILTAGMQTPVSVLYDSNNVASVHEPAKDFYDTLLRELDKEVSTNEGQ